ncbi:LysR family transcriptional regulator [Actinoplanes bogorensis]|uniref:LysR family transcriptional regulator n=1 Tax=Paractinoplanes bogorensis TaxID=1610840 RepID=A0ABS5YM13_9ACTN|nr:LysR family transcriptional regulator [Actinoplanes bogorensis]MBU2663784.1 LysR family transcriptional regulator [Actinoplanes bogorensis]
MSVSLRQLEAFVAVAAEAHFGRAATRIHVTQPVISQEIKRLERTLGATLFDRSTRSVALTTAGRELLPYAERTLAAVRELTVHAEKLSSTPHGEVRIAASPSVLDRFLADLVRRAERELPDITLTDVPVPTGEVEQALVAGHADLGLGRFLTAPDGYVVATIGREPVFALLSDTHRLARRATLNLAELADPDEEADDDRGGYDDRGGSGKTGHDRSDSGRAAYDRVSASRTGHDRSPAAGDRDGTSGAGYDRGGAGRVRRDRGGYSEGSGLPLLLWPRERHAAYFDHLVGICRERGLDPLLLAGPPQLVGARSYLISDGRAFTLVPESTAQRPVPGTRAIPLSRPATVPLEILMPRDPSPPARLVANLAMTKD